MPSIIPHRKRKQDCLLLTEDGRILEIKPAVVRGYVVEHKTQEAWELYPDYRIPKRGSNRLSQVIMERDMAPMSLDGDKKETDEQRLNRSKKQLSKIAQEHASEARSNIQKQSLKSKSAETLQLLAIILAIGVVVLVIFGLFMSGKLHIGGGGEGGIFSWSPVILGLFAPG